VTYLLSVDSCLFVDSSVESLLLFNLFLINDNYGRR